MSWLDLEILDRLDRLSGQKKVQYTVVNMPTRKGEEPLAEKVLVSWSAASRPFKRRSREFYITLISIVGLIGAILFLVEGFMPVILLLALLFLFYVLSTVKPDSVEYQITTYGVRFAGVLTDWGSLGRFWFVNRLGSDLLIFEIFTLPGRLELVIPHEMKAKAEDALKKYLIHEEVPPGVFDKAANWASKRLPQN